MNFEINGALFFVELIFDSSLGFCRVIFSLISIIYGLFYLLKVLFHENNIILIGLYWFTGVFSNFLKVW